MECQRIKALHIPPGAFDKAPDWATVHLLEMAPLRRGAKILPSIALWECCCMTELQNVTDMADISV